MSGNPSPSSARKGGAGASRQHQGSSAFTTVSPVYEIRRLVIAYGLQFHKDESLMLAKVDDYMNKRLQPSPDIDKISDTEYINHLQGVRFVIEETIKKQDFINYLKTPEIHLIYMGHARYGRGPCFGAHGVKNVTVEAKKKIHLSLILSEDWEEGSDADSGIFRMGFPYIGAGVSEIFQYGYTANTVKESEGKPHAKDCDPDLRPFLGSLHAWKPEQIQEGLVDKLRNHQDGDRYWTYTAPEHGRCVIHHAGWQETFSKPSELAVLDPSNPEATKMKCRVFSHLGCSTYIHNYPLVRKIAGWRHAENERYAYWTTAPSYPYALAPWIYNLITYDKYNAFSSWKPSLTYAAAKTNADLRKMGARYRLI